MRPTRLSIHMLLALAALLSAVAAQAIDLMPEILGDNLQLIALIPYNELQLEATTGDDGQRVKRCHNELSIDVIDGRDHVKFHHIETIEFEIPAEINPGYARYPVFAPVGQLKEGAYTIRLSLFNKLNGAKISRSWPLQMEPNNREAGTVAVVLHGQILFVPSTDWSWDSVESVTVDQAFATPPDSVLLYIDDLPAAPMTPEDDVWSATLQVELCGAKMKQIYTTAYFGARMVRTDYEPLNSIYMFEREYTPQEQLAQLRYVLNSNELRGFQQVDDDDLQAALDRFWAANDPTPDSPGNEIQHEFYERVRIADERYTIKGGRRGWQSDRGRIYIIHGEPDEVVKEVHPVDSRPYIIWRYYDEMKEYTFYDLRGFGNYELQNKWMD